MTAWCLLSASFFFSDITAQSIDDQMEWKAGVAGVVITPDQPIWMAGYGAREHPAKGTLHDLWAKALAVEDADGNRAVLVTTDLLGFPEEMSNHIRDQIEEQFGLSRSQIILNSSHTHSGPVLENALIDIYPLDSEQQALIKDYSRKLEDEIIQLVGNALDKMEPARLFAENGVTRFAVNRRNNPAATLYRATELAGPADYAVPVIKVEDSSGEMMAVVFGYACHPTVLSDYDWSGDFPGFAQLELEKAYPGVKAMFFQGAGADQNPLPRRSVALAEQYGKTLAAAVQRVLNEEMRELPSRLATAYSEVELNVAVVPTREELTERAEESSGYMQRWAERMLGKLDKDEEFRTSHRYPVQIWNIGDQMVVSLGGELVVEYAVRIKEIFGFDTFVMGYSNDVMAYIPTTKIIREGGYEGDQSQMVYGLPGIWSTDVEVLILSEILSLSESLQKN